MIRPCTLLAALLLPLCVRAADQVWRADLATTEVRNLYLRHGESADLTARLFLRGAPYAPTNAVAYYQTNGMAQAWWSAPCSITSNTVSVAWTPALDPGADLVSLLIRLDDSAYRAAAMLYLRPSPGAAPNVLPPPTQWLDFDKIAWTNAPWALPSDIPAPPVLSVNGKTGEVVMAAADVGAATVADATLVPAYSQTPTFSEWIVVKTPQGIDLDEVGVSFEVPYQTEDEEQWCFVFFGMNEGSGNTDPLATSLSNNAFSATRTRTDIIGYQVGSQADKPRAAASHTHPATDITGLPPAPDYSESNASLAATIQAVAPAPGDYATVSNRAMSALQSYTETDPTVPAWAKAANKPAYTPAEVGAAASSHQHASTDVTGLAAVATSGSYADLSGKPAIPTVPSVVSAFRNDAGYINASTATNIAENVGGGGVDDQTVSNLIARVLSEAGASAAATEIWRIILADHQRRLDALEDADGTDALTEAQAEAIVDTKCETWATNAIAPAVAAYRSAMQVANEAAAAWQGGGSGDYSSDEIEETQYTSTSAVSIDLSPTVATRYYRSASASATLTISSFSNPHNYPCWLLLDGYGSVTWPSGSAYAGAAYPGTAGAVYRVFKLNSKVYIERVY